jgi:hypothetical protein
MVLGLEMKTLRLRYPHKTRAIEHRRHEKWRVVETFLMCFISTCLVTYYINKQNYQYRAPKNPKEPQHRPLHSQKLTVRCGIASFWLLGPYIFEDNEGEAVIVTSERYVDMLCNFCEPELRRRGIDFSSVCFHQDGATAHTARTSMDFLREMFHSTWRCCSTACAFTWSLQLRFILMGISQQ